MPFVRARCGGAHLCCVDRQQQKLCAVRAALGARRGAALASTMFRDVCMQSTDCLQALSFGRGPPGPLVNGGLRPPGGVVSVRSKAMPRPRKAAGLLKSPVRSPSSSAARGPDGGRKSRLPITIDQIEHDQQHYRNARAKPRLEQPSVVLGSPRVSRPLDFEYWTGVFKFQILGSISRSTNLEGSERDRGWRAVQEG